MSYWAFSNVSKITKQSFIALGELCSEKLSNKGVYIPCLTIFISLKTYTTKPQNLHLKYHSCVPENLGKWTILDLK